jgi:argininosuccinate lyase
MFSRETNVMKRILTLAIPFILILAIFVLSKQPAGYRRELEKRDEKYRTSLDSIRSVLTVLREKDSKLSLRLVQIKDSLRISTETALKWKQRYDQAKRTPVRAISDPELDSLLSAYR